MYLKNPSKLPAAVEQCVTDIIRRKRFRKTLDAKF